MAPLAEANARQHETLERQAGTIREQAETIGRHVAELKAAEQRIADQQWELAAADASRRRERRRLSIALAMAGALATLGLAAPAWVR